MTFLRIASVAALALATLSACSNDGEVPRLMNLQSHQDSPDEFSIVPTQPACCGRTENLSISIT